ncbi:MAG TPA: hypothetical protein VLN44_10680 [Pyrinomonadaceae bacterium]|nr:hypothetical protein [Pyrinomonadaceae bacterium]
MTEHSQKGSGYSSHGFTIDPAALSGLSREQAMSSGTNVRDQLKRNERHRLCPDQ